jgi:hypothetical protein
VSNDYCATLASINTLVSIPLLSEFTVTTQTVFLKVSLQIVICAQSQFKFTVTISIAQYHCDYITPGPPVQAHLY